MNNIHHWLKPFFLVCLLVPIQQWSLAQSNYWQQSVQYTIDVKLNDQQHTLEGLLKLQYTNYSPDTLTYIWFHLWPNAFKNDKTAFSEQLLQNGRTDFYFSGKEQRGYINRLDFRVNNTQLKTEDHPLYIDAVKVFLPAPLAPGQQTTIVTPFHVQLPDNFSRGGHTKQSYQVTQWYPKPAVYDRKGWHVMPYLDQGEFYSEFGTYDVRITVPASYKVAATGGLQNTEELQWLQELSKKPVELPAPVVKNNVHKTASRTTAAAANKKSGTGNKSSATARRTAKPGVKTPVVEKVPVAARVEEPVKTLHYVQDKVHDFAWFADKNFVVRTDTIQLAYGKTVQAFCFYKAADNRYWKNSLQYLKDAIHFRSQLIGEYPYGVVSVVEAKMGFSGGMEYPTITSISPVADTQSLDEVIEHEVGHNWFYGILASNERDHPWMDEGMNSYYDARYTALKYPPRANENGFAAKLPANMQEFGIDALAAIKQDQPIATPSADFTEVNYGLIAYTKTALWMQQLEQLLGREKFDSCMQLYYRQWQFKHPDPEDFQQVIQTAGGRDVQAHFNLLQQKGSLTKDSGHKKIRPAFLFSFKEYRHTNYINIMPAAGYNAYDKFMLGLAIHNFTLPTHKFQFITVPLYATVSRQLNGIGGMSYSWFPGKTFQKIELGLGGARFSTLDGVDSNNHKITGGFYKVVPSLRFTFKNRSARSSLEKWIEWKTFFIGENSFEYKISSADSLFYPFKKAYATRYLNQLTFNITNYRVLYPYDVELQVQQGDGFYRATATGHYFFNYAKGGGMQMRVFAAKFGYLGKLSGNKELATAIYQPKLTAVRGVDDYTYSNYFIGRSEFEGFASQQIMQRDGNLKLRSDRYYSPAVSTNNWLAAMNLNTTLPSNLFPFKLPLRIFLDVGTYAESWKKNAESSRFLYVGGLQLSLFKDLLNVYAPLVYSSVFRNNLKSDPEENKFFKKLSFSIDVHRFNLRKFTNNKVTF